MMVSGGMGWKLPAIADVVVEDKIRHADPIGTVTMTCPADTVPRRMNCYRLASGPFGTHRAPHPVCSSCGGTWTVDRADSGEILASMVPITSGDQWVP